MFLLIIVHIEEINTNVDKNFKHPSLVRGVRRIDLSSGECGNPTGFYSNCADTKIKTTRGKKLHKNV